MRKEGLVFLFLCWLCGLWNAAAQTLAEQERLGQERVELKRRQVPKDVRRNVRLAYPYHVYKDWAKLDTLYSVRVISVNYETVYFDSTGEWLRAYRPVRPSELPYKTYLFLKEEFGVYRVLRAYQVQQSDDLAYYSVEMEHKRIHSLKTYLEFDFFGDLTMLDGEPVGGSGQTEEPEVLSREAMLALYGDVYDPVAEEAAYAAEAEAAALAAEVAEMVASADTLAVSEPDTVMPAVVSDTVAPADTIVSAMDTRVPMADTVSVEPADTAVSSVVDTAVVLPDTVPLIDTVVPADTVTVLATDTLPVVHPDTASVVLPDTASVQPLDTLAVVPAADTVAVLATDTASVILPDTASVQPLDTLAAVPADTATPVAPLYPEIVGKNFKKRFPNAEKITWRLSGEGLYLVTFDQFGQAMAAAFREDGVQVYTAYAFNRKEMPLPIERYLQASAAKMKMTEGWRVVHESKYKRMFASSERPKDYYYVVMGRKIPKSKKWQYIRYTFNQNAQFESKSNYVQPSEK